MANGINNLRKAFGKYPIGNSSPMKVLARQKFNMRLLIGGILAGVAIGVIIANEYHKSKNEKASKDPGRKNFDGASYNFDGNLTEHRESNVKPSSFSNDLLDEYLLRAETEKADLNQNPLSIQKRKLKKKNTEGLAKEEGNNAT